MTITKQFGAIQTLMALHRRCITFLTEREKKIFNFSSPCVIDQWSWLNPALTQFVTIALQWSLHLAYIQSGTLWGKSRIFIHANVENSITGSSFVQQTACYTYEHVRLDHLTQQMNEQVCFFSSLVQVDSLHVVLGFGQTDKGVEKTPEPHLKILEECGAQAKNFCSSFWWISSCEIEKLLNITWINNIFQFVILFMFLLSVAMTHMQDDVWKKRN